MISRPTLAPLALLCLFSFALSGCNRTIDDKKLGTQIEKKLEEDGDIEVESVECPKDRKLEDGDEFECEAEIKGAGSVEIAVKQTDDQGTVKWNTTKVVITAKKLSKTIGKDQKEGIQVDCGDGTLVIGKKATMCKINGPQGQIGSFEVTADEEGTLRWKPVE